MKKFLLFAAASLFLLASCSESEDLAANQGNAIEFRSVVDKTRASLVDDIENFFVKAYDEANVEFMAASVYKEGSTWTYSPKKYWPVDESEVNFYAFAPYSSAIASTIGSAGTLAYTVPNDQSGQNTAVDLLVATDSGSNGDTSVGLTFSHALSAVTFSAENANPTGSELLYTISKIEITGLANAGTYSYATDSWATTNSGITYTAGVPASGVAVQPGGTSVTLLSANDVMMVLPQTTTATTVEITYGLKDGSGAEIYPATTTKTFNLPSSFEFEVGTRYNFAFTFDASNAIEFDVDVNGWLPVSVAPTPITPQP